MRVKGRREGKISIKERCGNCFGGGVDARWSARVRVVVILWVVSIVSICSEHKERKIIERLGKEGRDNKRVTRERGGCHVVGPRGKK